MIAKKKKIYFRTLFDSEYMEKANKAIPPAKRERWIPHLKGRRTDCTHTGVALERKLSANLYNTHASHCLS